LLKAERPDAKVSFFSACADDGVARQGVLDSESDLLGKISVYFLGISTTTLLSTLSMAVNWTKEFAEN
jgi:hypothetical protein